MATIKSSNEHLTFNADGSAKEIRFQANGTQKASISSAGAFTSTTIDATVLTGNLPALNGAALTGVAPTKSTVEALGIDVPAANLTGTIADARFPATLPAISGANLTGLSSFDPDAAVTINESGADVDFRVESDVDTHSLFVEGSSGFVGVGKTDPGFPLHIEANANYPLYISQTGTIKHMIALRGNGSGLDIAVDGANNYVQFNSQHADDDIRFDTGDGTERMRITSDGKIKVNEITNLIANTSQGIQFAKVSWNNASSKTVATFNLGGHSAAAWTMWVTHTDWSDHSGGGRIVSGVMNSGYGSPGEILSDSFSPDNFQDITFSIGTSSNTRILQVSGGNSNGPNGVHIMMMACSPGSWTLAQS